MKALLTKGKVVIAGLMGDEAILQAMRTNEGGHQHGVRARRELQCLQANTRDVLQKRPGRRAAPRRVDLEQLKHH